MANIANPLLALAAGFLGGFAQVRAKRALDTQNVERAQLLDTMEKIRASGNTTAMEAMMPTITKMFGKKSAEPWLTSTYAEATAKNLKTQQAMEMVKQLMGGQLQPSVQSAPTPQATPMQPQSFAPAQPQMQQPSQIAETDLSPSMQPEPPTSFNYADKPMISALRPRLQASAQQYGVPEDLAAAIMNAESGGNPQAVSPKGAIGPMQLMPATAKELGVNPQDVGQNIDGGVRYYSQQLARYGNPIDALIAYNMGPTYTDLWISQGRDPAQLPAETKYYVQRVMAESPSLQALVRPAFAEEPPLPEMNPADYPELPTQEPTLSVRIDDEGGMNFTAGTRSVEIGRIDRQNSLRYFNMLTKTGSPRSAALARISLPPEVQKSIDTEVLGMQIAKLNKRNPNEAANLQKVIDTKFDGDWSVVKGTQWEGMSPQAETMREIEIGQKASETQATTAARMTTEERVKMTQTVPPNVLQNLGIRSSIVKYEAGNARPIKWNDLYNPQRDMLFLPPQDATLLGKIASGVDLLKEMQALSTKIFPDVPEGSPAWRQFESRFNMAMKKIASKQTLATQFDRDVKHYSDLFGLIPTRLGMIAGDQSGRFSDKDYQVWMKAVPEGLFVTRQYASEQYGSLISQLLNEYHRVRLGPTALPTTEQLRSSPPPTQAMQPTSTAPSTGEVVEW